MERSRYLLILVFAALTACGGGGGEDGGETGNTNVAPTAAAGSDRSEYATTTVELVGSGDDSDGSIASYSWKQTGGPTVSLTGASSDTATFEAPDVDDSTDLTFEVTVTDDGAAQATDSVVITIVPAFEISGRAYDGPIANARITADVNGLPFRTAADANGMFKLLIGSTDPDALVVLYAQGPDGSDHVSLMGFGASFATLKALAGEDNLLEATESGAVNITNVTSAVAALIMAANNGALPVSQAELEALELQVNGDAVVRLATAIKLVIDGGFELPADVGDTLDLVSDNSFVDAFLDAVALLDATAYDTVEAEMLADATLFPAFKEGDIASAYDLFLVNSFEISGQSDYNTAGRALELNLDAGGTGSLYSYLPQQSFTWSVVDGEVVMEHVVVPGPEKYCYIEIDGYMQQAACETHTSHSRMQMIADGAGSDVVRLTTTYETTYPNNPEVSPETYDRSYVYVATVDSDFELGLTADDMVGAWAFHNVIPGASDPNRPAYTAILDFAANGVGSSRANTFAPATAFSWNVSAEGNLVMNFVDGSILTVEGYRREGIAYDVLHELVNGNQERYVYAELMVKVEEDFAFTTDPVNFAGSYEMHDEYPYYTVTVADDGTGHDNGYIDGEPTQTAVTAWTLLDDGRLKNTKGVLWMSGERVGSCDGQPDCYELQRYWTPVAYDEALNRLFVLEERRTIEIDSFGAVTEEPLHMYLKFWGKREIQ